MALAELWCALLGLLFVCSKLDELMMEAIPRVNEVNAMCEEMNLRQRFAVILLANQDKVAATIRKGKEEYFETLVMTGPWWCSRDSSGLG